MFSEEVKRVKAKSWKEPHLVWPSDFTDEKTPGSRSGNDVFKVTWLIKSTWTQMRLSLLIPLQNIFNKDFLAFVLRWWNYFLNWRGKKLTIYSSDTLKDSSFLVVCLIWKKTANKSSQSLPRLSKWPPGGHKKYVKRASLIDVILLKHLSLFWNLLMLSHIFLLL